MPFKKPHHTSDQSYVEKKGDSYEIKPRGLDIVWGNDYRYWSIAQGDGPAKLIQVSWLEVSGKVRVQKHKKYTVKFHVKVNEDGFGWNGTDVLVMAKLGKSGKYTYQEDRLRPGQPTVIPSTPLEIEVKEADADLHFGLYEVWSGKWKGGLELIKAEVKLT